MSESSQFFVVIEVAKMPDLSGMHRASVCPCSTLSTGWDDPKAQAEYMKGKNGRILAVSERQWRRAHKGCLSGYTATSDAHAQIVPAAWVSLA